MENTLNSHVEFKTGHNRFVRGIIPPPPDTFSWRILWPHLPLFQRENLATSHFIFIRYITYVNFAVIMNSLENPNLKSAVYC